MADQDSDHKLQIMYSTDGKGKWWKRTWPPRCDGDGGFFASSCQGEATHLGDHWWYDKRGSYHWALNKKDPNYVEPGPHDGVGGTTSADSPSYVHPADRIKDVWLSHGTYEEVTDPVKIAKLEEDEYEDGATINRPCSDKEIQWLKDSGRLDGLLDE